MAPRTKKTHKIAVEESMTIYTASSQKFLLMEAISNCQELDIDMSQVGEIDTAGFQLLLLTKREAAKAGKVVRITAHSKAVRELLDLYSMGGFFGDPLLIPAHEHSEKAA